LAILTSLADGVRVTKALRRESRLEGFIDRPRRALWRLAAPIMVGMSLQTAYMLVDMYFVGRIGSDALAALAFNMPLVFLALGIVFGLGSGVTSVIARYIGAKDEELADASAEHATLLGLAVSAALTTVALFWGRRILGLLGVPEAILPLAWDYFSIIAAGYLFVVMSVFFRSILSGEGDMKTPMMIQGAGTILNMILDPIFIFTFGLGVRGAAWATVVSQAVPAAIFVYLLFFNDHAYVKLDFKGFRPRTDILVEIFRVGAPASFSFLIMAVGGAVFNRILVEYSEEAVAAYQVGTRIDHVFLMPVIAISVSLVTLVGMFYGARREDLVRAVVGYAVTRSVGLGVVVGAVFFVFAPNLFAAFGDDRAITDAGVSYLRVGVFAYPFIAVIMLTGRVLQGMGRGAPVFVLSVMRVVLLSGPLAYLFVFEMHKPIEWVWFAIVGGMVATAVLAGAWLSRALARHERSMAAATLPAGEAV
jgi:putative MATE family efflux protein